MLLFATCDAFGWKKRSRQLDRTPNVNITSGQYTIECRDFGERRGYFLTYKRSVGQSIAKTATLGGIAAVFTLIFGTAGAAALTLGAGIAVGVPFYFLFQRHVLELSKSPPIVFTIENIKGTTKFTMGTKFVNDDTLKKDSLYVSGNDMKLGSRTVMVAKPARNYPKELEVHLKQVSAYSKEKWLYAGKHQFAARDRRKLKLYRYKMSSWKLNPVVEVHPDKESG